MLGQPIAMLIPDVIGFRLTGKLPEGATATDLVLTVTQMLRRKGVVGQVRRILRAGAGRTGPRRPRHHRQHGAGVRRDLRLLPGGQGGARLPAPDRPRRAPHRAGRGLSEGAGHVPRARHAGAGVHRHAGTRSVHRGAEPRRPEAAAGPRGAEGRRVGVQGGADQGPRRAGQRRGHAGEGRGQELRDHPRRRGDRRDHVLHQHVEPVGAGRRRPGRAQGARQGADGRSRG